MARLTEHVEKLFHARPRQQTIANLSKLSGLSESWLAEYSKGRMKIIHADKLQSLYEVLTGDTTRLNF